jgi:hypothetical protein
MRRRKQMIIKKFWWLLPIFVVALAGFAVWAAGQTNNQERKVLECAGVRDSDFNCWRERYEAMVTQDSPKEAFADFRQNYESISYVKSNCHQIAHVIGRTASKKYKDVGTAYDNGDNFCWSGYYHGVMEGVANSLGVEELLNKLNIICDGPESRGKYSFYHYNCVHGIGHGLMVVYENELFTSLEMCDRLHDRWEQDSCHGGVFMENVMAELNPDHTTKYLSREEPLYPCTAVSDRYKTSCYMMQTSHALVVLNQDYSKVFELCGTVGDYAATCYQSLGRDASGSTSSDVARTRELCMLGKTHTAQENCVIGAVKDFISYHHDDTQAHAFCNSLQPSLVATCTQTATDYYKSF